MKPGQGSLHRQRTRATAIVTLLALLVLVGGSAAPIAGQTLQEIWAALVGKQGILEEKTCGYVLTLSRPTQSGNAIVKAVHSDHVVLVVDRDQSKVEYVIPLSQITLRTPPA
jgi:hypothetical protein